MIMVPKRSSVFCASGMLISDLRHDLVSVAYMLMRKESINIDLINEHFKMMRARGTELLRLEKISTERMRFSYSCDLRYEGQFNEIETPVQVGSDGKLNLNDLPALQNAFDRKHDALYGYSLSGSLMELVSLRVRAEGITEKPSFKENPYSGEDASGAIKGRRDIYYGGKPYEAVIYNGNKLAHGNKFEGLAVIEEPTTTMLVAPNYQVVCDRYCNYLMFHKGLVFEEVLNQMRSV